MAVGARLGRSVLVLCTILQATCDVLQQRSRCLQNVPEVFPKQRLLVAGEPRPILLDGRTGVNPAADFANHVVGTLAAEVLGYEDVRIVSADADFHNSTVALQRVSGCADYNCRAVLMPNDASQATVNMEVWQDNLLEMSLWLETGTVKSNGFLGFTARYGWFVSRSLVAQMWERHQLVADHWKSLHAPAVIRRLLVPMSELRRLVVAAGAGAGPPTALPGKPRGKATGYYYCERAECVRGMFVPPVCRGANRTLQTTECSTLLAGYPDTSFDALIGQIASLRLPVAVAWIGPALEPLLASRSRAGLPTLFLGWSPHPLTASSGLFRRVALPVCAGPGCDFRPRPVRKLSWLPLAYGCPDLDAMIAEVSFGDSEMLAILGRYRGSRAGAMREFACEWLKSNPAVWRGWIPNKLNPKKKIYLGGLFPDHIPAFSGIGIGARLAVDAVNADSDVLASHELELVVDGSDGSDAVASYLRLQDDKTKPITGVIGPMRSEDSKIVASIAALFKTVLISYGADSPALSNRNLYPFFAGMLPSAAEDAYALAKLFQHYNWQRYAALSDSDVSNREAMLATAGVLEEQGITLVSSQSFANALPLNPALFFEDIKNQRARLIVGLFSDAAARVVLCEAFKQDMTGHAGYQWFLPSLYADRWWDTDYHNGAGHHLPESVPCRTHEMARAVAGYVSLSRVHVAAGGERLPGGETAGRWLSRYQMTVDKQGKQASAFAAYAYDAVWAFALSYENLLQERPRAPTLSRQDRDSSSFMAYLSRTRFRGMTGEVVFAGSDRQGPVQISQHLPRGSEVTVSFGLYIPYVANSSEWTGTLQLNASDVVWLNDGQIPDDGTVDEAACAVESFQTFLGVDCQSAMAILNAFLIIVVFIILVIFVVLVKKAYDRKVKKAEERVKDLGIIALGQSTLLSLDKWEVPRDNVILNRKLGEGAFGTVYGGEAMLNRSQWAGVAVKTLKVESTFEEKLDFLSEAEMMKRFDHRNIVKLLGVCTRREPIYTIMDFMLHGDLKTFLLARRHLVGQSHADDSSVSPERLTSMVLDVALGVGYLAANKYVHRDLACRNCLVDCTYTVKIADFGMTRATYDSNYYRLNREGKMPVRWMAPESVNEGVFTAKSDVWSLGIVVYEVVTFGGFPYKELTNADVLDYIRSNNSMRPPADCSPPLAALMQHCWSIEPEERPTASDIAAILATHPRLIRPSINEPITSILGEDPAQALAATPRRATRGDSLRSDGVAGAEFQDAPRTLSRTDRVASLGRRLRASFARTLSLSPSRGPHAAEPPGPERKAPWRPQSRSMLGSSTQELAPSTLSVITCTTRSSSTSLDQSRASSGSASAQRDSSSSSGVDCDGVSAGTARRESSLPRRSAADSVTLDPTEKAATPVGRSPRGRDSALPCSVAIQSGDEAHLLPCRPKTRQSKRSRSRSLGNLRSPRTPGKLLRGSGADSESDATSSV